jgi:hypothetical protein
VPRAGFDYPLRDVHHRSSRCDKRIGASMGFTLQGVSLVTIGAPLGALALLPLPRHTLMTPEGRACDVGRLQGLVPVTNPC